MATTQVPKLTPEQRSHRAKLAAHTRHKPDTAIDELRDFRAERLADHIQSVVDAAPPLTETQRAYLAQLLVPVQRAGASA